MEMKTITIVTINDEPYLVSGGESKDQTIRALSKAIKLIKANDVEHVKEEE